MKRLLPLLLAPLVAGCGSGPEEGLPLGSTAPEVKVETLLMPSTTSSLSKKRGKVVLMDFWATWCGPCKAITPTLEALYAKYHAEGLEGMAITTEAREIVAINEKKNPHRMPVFLDSSEEATRTFGARALPTIVVIDRTGQIVYRTAGVSESTPAELDDIIQKALRAN